MRELLAAHPELFSSPLLAGISQEGLARILQCTCAAVRRVERGSPIISEGDPADKFGIIVEGSAQSERVDLFGNRTIIDILPPGAVFAAASACSPIDKMPISVIARTDCVSVIVAYPRVISICQSSCEHHKRILLNLMVILATQAVTLNTKITILSARTTRAKLCAYLSSEAERAGSKTFEIPLTRAELADYISVDRSAMSSEISKMKRDGLIDVAKNKFTLLSAI